MRHQFAQTSVPDRGVRKKCAQCMPSTLSVPTSMASVLTDLTTKSTNKLLVEPPTTMCGRNVLSEFRVHSSIPISELSVLIDLRTECGRRSLLAPPAAAGLALEEKKVVCGWPEVVCGWPEVVCGRMAGGRLRADGRRSSAGGRPVVVCVRMAGGRLRANGRRSSACGWTGKEKKSGRPRMAR